MKKLIAVVVISLGLSVGALADDKTYTIQDTINTVSQIPVKVSSYISEEVDKTKEFQKANWAKVKVQWYNLISKFSSN
jgi:thymidine phosphorylase